VTSDLNKFEPTDLLVFVVPSKAMHATAALAANAGLGKSQPIVLSVRQGHRTELRFAHEPDCWASTWRLPTGCADQSEARARKSRSTSPRLPSPPRRTCSCYGGADVAFRVPWFRCYTSDDLVGVEWAGAMKNPYAIAAGIAAGLQLGDNAIAALVTRALAEMVRLGVQQGGRMETFDGLSGVGDLVATCYSEHSRNHRLGLALGRGQKLADIRLHLRMIAEGVPNALTAFTSARRLRVSALLC